MGALVWQLANTSIGQLNPSSKVLGLECWLADSSFLPKFTLGGNSDGLSTWIPATTSEACIEFLAPGFGLLHLLMDV